MKFDDYMNTLGNDYENYKAKLELEEEMEDWIAKRKAKEKIYRQYINNLPSLLEDPEFKATLIQNKANRNEKGQGYPTTMESILDRDQSILFKSSADRVINLIIQDPDLRRVFLFENKSVATFILAICCRNPNLVGKLLRNESLMEAVQKNSYPCISRDMLYASRDKEDADYVFSNPLFGGWGEELKEHIYNIISKNFKKSLPESLQARSLFALAKSRKSLVEQEDELPENLKKDIRNIRPGNGC